jgi:UPF0042 nucleotide-binding protein
MSTTDNGEPREVVLVTGISGSGKSVALNALEDAGFFCIDNLPPELLRDFLRLEQQRDNRRVAVAVDVRSAGSLPHLVPLLEQLRAEGVVVRSIFLDASTDALVRRFSETRRPHPLSQTGSSGIAPATGTAEGHRALIDAIELERELLADLREVSTVIDSSQLRTAQLRIWVRDLMRVGANQLTLVFESFVRAKPISKLYGRGEFGGACCKMGGCGSRCRNIISSCQRTCAANVPGAPSTSTWSSRI